MVAVQVVASCSADLSQEHASRLAEDIATRELQLEADDAVGEYLRDGAMPTAVTKCVAAGIANVLAGASKKVVQLAALTEGGRMAAATEDVGKASNAEVEKAAAFVAAFVPTEGDCVVHNGTPGLVFATYTKMRIAMVAFADRKWESVPFNDLQAADDRSAVAICAVLRKKVGSLNKPSGFLSLPIYEKTDKVGWLVAASYLKPPEGGRYAKALLNSDACTGSVAYCEPPVVRLRSSSATESFIKEQVQQ